MFGGGFKSSKCKTLLRLAMARIKLLRNKRDIQVKQMRKDIAQLLQTGQEPSARIRVEHISREQNVMAAYDILELFCELLTVRLPIIEAQKNCPLDLKEAVSSLIFAAPRCADLPELVQIRNLFTTKYGKEFVAAAAELRPECGVNRRIIEKLSVRAPSGEVKLKLLKEIAEEFKVEWDPADTEAELLKRPEDLLDGPKQFYGASSAPLSEVSHVPSSVSESSSLPRRAPDVPAHSPQPPPPSAPSAPAPIQMLPLDQSSDEDSSPNHAHPRYKPQFLPFLGPHPSQRVQAEPTTNLGGSSTTNISSSSEKYGSHKASSRSDRYSHPRKEDGMDYEKSENYLNVDDAVQAAAEYSNRAAAAARAAAALRRSRSLSPSPPRARRSSLRPSNLDSDEEDSAEKHPRRSQHERRRPSTRYPEEISKHERDNVPKRSDSDRSRDSVHKKSDSDRSRDNVLKTSDSDRSRDNVLKRSDSDKSTDGAPITRRNIDEEKEFSFRLNSQEDLKSSISKKSSSDDRDETSRWRTNSNERKEGSGRSKSEDPKESTARSNSDNGEVIFRRNSSGNRGGGIFSNQDEDQQQSISWKRGSQNRVEYDVEPPPKVDPENESFWKPNDPDWRSGVDIDLSKKIDSGIFTGHAEEEDMEYMRKSSLSKRNDYGRYGDRAYSNASNVFSRADSADSNLFKRSDSADQDLRSSDEYYDSKQGFSTPKFDDDDHSSSHGNPTLSSRYEEDLYKKNSSSTKSSFNETWGTDSSTQQITAEDEAFVKKYSFVGREDMKPLDKAKSDTLVEKDGLVRASSIERAGSDPLYSRWSPTDESRISKAESPTPFKSRRTRVNRDKSEDGDSPVRRSKTYTQEDSASIFLDSPNSLRPIPFKPSPSSNSSAYESPETQRESPAPITLTHSASGSSNASPRSVHPKLPDIDDLTARFEALKAAKR